MSIRRRTLKQRRTKTGVWEIEGSYKAFHDALAQAQPGDRIEYYLADGTPWSVSLVIAAGVVDKYPFEVVHDDQLFPTTEFEFGEVGDGQVKKIDGDAQITMEATGIQLYADGTEATPVIRFPWTLVNPMGLILHVDLTGTAPTSSNIRFKWGFEFVDNPIAAATPYASETSMFGLIQLDSGPAWEVKVQMWDASDGGDGLTAGGGLTRAGGDELYCEYTTPSRDAFLQHSAHASEWAVSDDGDRASGAANWNQSPTPDLSEKDEFRPWVGIKRTASDGDMTAVILGVQTLRTTGHGAAP